MRHRYAATSFLAPQPGHLIFAAMLLSVGVPGRVLERIERHATHFSISMVGNTGIAS